MNIIKTVGDLKKALSVYSDNLPLEVYVGHVKVGFNNDTQLARVVQESGETFRIMLVDNE